MFGDQVLSPSQEGMGMFRQSAVDRKKCLDGECAIDDFMALYRQDGTVTLEDAIIWDPDEYSVRLVRTRYAFVALMYAFCGEVANMRLPRGVFFSGSAVLASATMPISTQNPNLEQTMARWGWIIVESNERARMVLACRFQKLQGSGCPELVEQIMEFVGCAAELQAVRAALDEHVDEGDRTPADDDPMCWDWNGCGSYNRADVDVFVAAGTIEEANRKVHALHRKFCAAGDVVVIRTPNTITYCRSWPERHVQVVLLVGQHAFEHCLFCDFDCTSLVYDGGEVYTTARSRHALVNKVNVVPPRMLQLRKDEPKRVAKYVKRGFRVMMLRDDLFDEARQRVLMMEVENQWAYVQKSYLKLYAHARSMYFGWEAMYIDVDGAADGEMVYDRPVCDGHGFVYDRSVWDSMVASILASDNSCYSELNIPRMPGLTAGGIEKFFHLLAAQKNSQVSSLVQSSDEIPPCVWKLEDRRPEEWADWNFV